MATDFSTDTQSITNIEDNQVLFTELRGARDIPEQFLPQDSDHCLVITSVPTKNGELEANDLNKINAFARAHIADPCHTRWLLVHILLANNPKPQSTLVCFIEYSLPNALVDNMEGAGVANQIVAALQALQAEGLVTTNVNYELIRKMNLNLGAFFGGSFANLANSLRVYSVNGSVKKSEKVAHDKGLLTPTRAPALESRLGRAGAAAGVANVLQDEIF